MYIYNVCALHKSHLSLLEEGDSVKQTSARPNRTFSRRVPWNLQVVDSQSQDCEKKQVNPTLLFHIYGPTREGMSLLELGLFLDVCEGCICCNHWNCLNFGQSAAPQIGIVTFGWYFSQKWWKSSQQSWLSLKKTSSMQQIRIFCVVVCRSC